MKTYKLHISLDLFFKSHLVIKNKNTELQTGYTKDITKMSCLVAHCFSTSTQEAEAGGSLSVKTVWYIQSYTEKPCFKKNTKNFFK